MIVELNIKLIEENLWGLGLCKESLELTPKAQFIWRLTSFISSDLKKIGLQKLKDEKKKAQNRRKYFQNIASDKGLLWTMYKELSTQQLEIPAMQLKSRKKIQALFHVVKYTDNKVTN